MIVNLRSKNKKEMGFGDFTLTEQIEMFVKSIDSSAEAAMKPYYQKKNMKFYQYTFRKMEAGINILKI